MIKRFSPTTIVEPSIKIRRQRLLPTTGEITVRIGQEVSPVQVVARSPRETRFQILPVSEQLQIDPADLPELLKVEIGERVDADKPLLQTRKRWRQQVITSPVNAVVYDVQHGRIILQELTDWLELRAMVRGRVASHIPNRGVEMEIVGAVIQANWGSDKESVGRLLMSATMPDDTFLPSQLGSEASGRILVVGLLDNEEALKKAEDAGVRAIIAASMPARMRQMAIDSSMPILLTEGWGELPMSPKIFQLLLAKDGEEATVFGKPADHWGQRPEIIIPTTETPKTNIAEIRKPLAVGQTVRITRAPFHGQSGEIVHLYRLGRDTAVGTKAHGADIKLSDGRQVFVPLANIDTII